jgi:hypothetical protein
MKYINYSFEPLYENLGDAMTFMKKRVASKMLKKDMSMITKSDIDSLTPDELELGTKQPKFIDIQNLLNEYNKINYALPFTRFHFEHGAKIRGPIGEITPERWQEVSENASLEKLLNILKKDPTVINQLSIKSLDQYAAQSTVNGVNTFEALFDEIRTIYRNKGAKWFINVLPVRLREQFRESPQDLQQEFFNAAYTYRELGKEAILRITEKIAAFKNWNIEDAIAYIKTNLRGYANANVKKTIQLLRELEPQAGILYFGEGYLAMSMRTEYSQKELCSIANWCINRGSFRTYVENRVQINIFDFNLDQTDPMFLTGTTANYDKTIHASHDINDKRIVSGKMLDTHLSELGYPQDLIDEIYKKFNSEVAIKKIVYTLKLDQKAIDPVNLLSRVNQSGNYFTDIPDNETLNTIFKIIDDNVQSGITEQGIMTVYGKIGILNQLSAMVFTRLTQKVKVSGENISKIVESSIKNFEKIESISRTNPALLNAAAKNILDQKDLVLDKIQKFL